MQHSSYLKIFNSTIFRSIGSLLTTFIIVLFLGNLFIKKLIKLNINQKIRKNGPHTHLYKQNTPTMGGILILISILFSTLLWNNLLNTYIWYFLYILISYGSIGLIDDIIKIMHNNSNGLSVKCKYFWLSFFALIIITIMYYIEKEPNTIKLIVPFIKSKYITIGVFYFVLSYCTITGTSNAVNLTDGLDGLVIVPIIGVSFILAIVAYISGNVHNYKFFNVLYLKNATELTIVCMSIIGSNIGFLWFNCYPAQVFMGDVGALSLGGVLGLISVLLRQEFLLVITGGIFVIETISVIIQIFSTKIIRKKVFLMTPLHHHFELLGNLEPKITIRFWIVSFILTLIGFITLII